MSLLQSSYKRNEVARLRSLTDQIILDLAPGWVLGADNLQWILGRVVKPPPGAGKTVAGARLRPKAFIASTKAVLRRCIHEYEIELTPEVAEYIEALPETFRVWNRRHRLRVVQAPERDAA